MNKRFASVLSILILCLISCSENETEKPNHGFDLPGIWRFQPGDSLEWANPEFADTNWNALEVPGNWENQAFPRLDGFAWYRLHFDLPAEYLAEDVVFILGQINDTDETFLNGQKIGGMGDSEKGESAHKFTRKYPVEKRLLKPVNNVMAIRVFDMGNLGGIVRGPLRVVKKSNLVEYQRPTGLKPPVTPEWAYEPWIWEDDENTQAAVMSLVGGYETHSIPVGAVIIDSPWATAYNTFVFDSVRYPDPQSMIEILHQKGIRVICWFTCMINNDAPTYNEARRRDFFLNDAEVFEWWKGKGSHIDYTNPEAVAWWHRQMDRVFDLNIDGWKVDNSETYVPDFSKCFRGEISKREYTVLYYRDAHQYTIMRSPDAITLARSVDYSDREDDPEYSPIDCTPASWVGDQRHDFSARGFGEALRNIFKAAEVGYHFVGSDIGGFNGGPELTKTVFLRWAQFSAFNPLMLNGGVGEHRPWKFDSQTTEVFRYYATLHSELVPYLYSYGIHAHRTGEPIIRPCETGKWQFRLGNELFISVLHNQESRRIVHFPEGEWIDYWDESKTYNGPDSVEYEAPLLRYPVFIRSGAILPLRVQDEITGHGSADAAQFLTLLVYPAAESDFTYYPDPDTSVRFESNFTGEELVIGFDAIKTPLIFRIHLNQPPLELKLKSGSDLPALETMDAWKSAENGWLYDGPKKKLLVKCPGENGDSILAKF
ncbi:hypothetical protein JXJ21_09780 [candidate division KSB1 bacterium]|nr:hypothetical protein [candidate division KSB1 bacterium]